jgi:hypothetical protein
MARLPAAQENTAIAALFVPATTYYFALYTTDPGTSGASGEVTGGSYARQAFTFTSASGGVETNVASVSFTAMPAESGGVPYCGVFTASSGGTYLGGGLTSGLSSAIASGATVSFAIGAISAAVS